MDEPELLGRATSPRGEVLLRRVHRGGRLVLELRVNGIFVMDDAETTSERALAAESLSRCVSPRRMLVGGLGLGFTLAEVLGDGRVERVRVVEIEPAVVDWMREGTVPHGSRLVSDPRVEVVVGDVADVIAGSDEAAYDLVLLDVDNGPAYLVHEDNARLYRTDFLRRCRDALSPGGLLVIWSMTREDGLLDALRATFAERAQSAAERAGNHRERAENRVSAVSYDVRLGARDEQYWLHLAHRA
ncbi:hypothetical protein KLP28_11915 [Nocardioidaceae bacterium]|nr:hypothetical protein KLP28_11915 [Nocardioidaceae bacterium]